MKQEYLWLKIFFDVVCTAVAGFCVLLFYLIGSPRVRGFYCNDDTIRYPYRDSTVTNVELYVVGIFVPIMVMLITEAIHAIRRRKGHFERNVEETTYVLCGKEVPLFVSKCYFAIGIFLFGACLSQICTDIAKYSVGRLRPHFINVCKPDINCQTGENKFRYIEDYKCENDDLFRVREARLSFLSGHASFSAYAMVYLVLYLQCRMTCKYFKLGRPFIQAAFLMIAWYTALSRVTDYKHHPTDVLAGCVLGTVVAVIVVLSLTDFFKKQSLFLPTSVVPRYQEDQVGTQLVKMPIDAEGRQAS